MSGQGIARVRIVGRIQSLFRQPGNQKLFITVGRNEGYNPTLYLQPEASKNQTWCLVQAKGDTSSATATGGYYICSYPDLSHYLRLSEHDINPLDSESFCYIDAVELPAPITEGGTLPDLGHNARFSVQDAGAPSLEGGGCSIRSANVRAAVLQAGTRESEPCPGMRVCAHSQKEDTREIWLLEKSIVD